MFIIYETNKPTRWEPAHNWACGIEALIHGGAGTGEDGQPSAYGLFSHRIALVGATNIIGTVGGIILLPLLTRSMSADHYGIWVQFVVTVTLFPFFVDFGLPVALVRFLAAEKRIERIREGFYSVLAVVLVAAGIASLVFALLAPQIASVLFGGREDVVRIVAMAAFFECVNIVLFNYLRAFQRIKLYSGFQILQTVLLLGLLAPVLLSGLGLIGAVSCFLITRIAIMLTLMGLVVRWLGLIRPRFSRMREFLDFGLPLVPMNLSNWALTSIDRYLIGLFLGVLWVGYYNPGYSLGTILLMIVTPLRFLLPAALSELYDKEMVRRVRTYLSYSLKYFLVLAIPGSVGLGILSKELLLILTTEEIAGEGYLVTPIIAGAMLLYGAQIIMSQVLILKKRTRIIGSVMVAAAIVNIGGNVIAIPLLGMIGAAYSTFVAFAFALVVTTYFAMVHLRFDIDTTAIAKTVLGTLLMLIIIYLMGLFDPFTGHLGTILRILTGIGVYGCSTFLLGTLSKDEYKFFKGLIRKPRKS
jgi:O-antigen/teichoic acid export membrane protein